MDKVKGTKLKRGDILYKYVFDDDGGVHLYEVHVIDPMNKAGRIHATDSERTTAGYFRGEYLFNVACIDERILDARKKSVLLSKPDFQKAKTIVLNYLEERLRTAERQYESAKRRFEGAKRSSFTDPMGF